MSLAHTPRAADGGALLASVLTEALHVQQRLVRASSIHGLAGMAAIMASTYKAYMGEGLGDFGKWLMKFKIPHFGKVRERLLPACCTHDIDKQSKHRLAHSRQQTCFCRCCNPLAQTSFGVAHTWLALLLPAGSTLQPCC
jgi:hypothetical protein